MNVYKKNSSRLMDQRPSLDQIIQNLRRMMPELTSTYGVQTLGLFGSFVHGAQNQRSDLDLLVDFKRVPTLFQFIRLEKDLKEKLGIKVDLVMKTALKPNIGRQILREVIPI
jgi:predicted nucleotidyltransferase